MPLILPQASRLASGTCLVILLVAFKYYVYFSIFKFKSFLNFPYIQMLLYIATWIFSKCMSKYFIPVCLSSDVPGNIIKLTYMLYLFYLGF